MAAMTVRQLPDDVKQALRERAARAGHSLEEEARRVLTEAARRPMPERKPLGQLVYELSRPGFDIPQAPDRPASFAAFDDE